MLKSISKKIFKILCWKFLLTKTCVYPVKDSDAGKLSKIMILTDNELLTFKLGINEIYVWFLFPYLPHFFLSYPKY